MGVEFPLIGVARIIAVVDVEFILDAASDRLGPLAQMIVKIMGR